MQYFTGGWRSGDCGQEDLRRAVVLVARGGGGSECSWGRQTEQRIGLGLGCWNLRV